MNDTSDSGGTLPTELTHLARLGGTFVENERGIRVALLDAIDAGHSLEAVAEAAGLPRALVEEWTGAAPGPAQESRGSARLGVVDEVGEQRRLRTGSLSQRVAAADAKNARAESLEDLGPVGDATRES